MSLQTRLGFSTFGTLSVDLSAPNRRVSVEKYLDSDV